MSGASASEKNWWAKVMYPSYNNRKEIVQVKDSTKRFCQKPDRLRTPFQPKALQDFNGNMLYLVETSDGSKDGNPHPYYCYIRKMYGE